MPATYYPAIIDRSATGFGVTFPDFPGCVANGSSVSDACVQGEKALALHLEAMVKDKDAIPQPSDCEEVRADLAEDEVVAMIRADVPVKVERVLVSIDSNLLRAIDAAATNRSAFFADAARAHLGGVVAVGIIGQSELATMSLADLEQRYGLKPKRVRLQDAAQQMGVKQ